MATPNADWQTFLADATLTRFPRLTDVIVPDAERVRRKMPVVLDVSSNGMRRFCEKYELPLASVLHAAWALVLRSYTGLNNVAFGNVVPEGKEKGAGGDMWGHGYVNGRSNGGANGGANGYVDGHGNGHGNGHSNGHGNGHSNGGANGGANGHGNGYGNGRENGLTNDRANGHSNGGGNSHANEHGNGYENGHSNGGGNGHANGHGNGHENGHSNGVANGSARTNPKSKANFLPCHLASIGESSVMEILAAVRQQMNQGEQAEKCTLEDIKNQDGQFIFDTVTVLRTSAGRSAIEMELDKVECEVVVEMTAEIGHDIRVELQYCTSTLCNGQAANVASTLGKAISCIVQQPHDSVRTLNLISERNHRDLELWFGVPPEKQNVCAHDMIQREVAARPEASAVESWDGNLSYAQLDELSTSLAHHLVSLGVGPEVIVPLCFEKSMWAIVSMLSVIKAGGVMLFLDSTHPLSRLEEILSQVEAKVVVTSFRNRELLAPLATVVVVDPDSMSKRPMYSVVPETGVQPSNAMYVIFTSGSTGKPKGVVIEHASFCSGAINQGTISGFFQRTSRVMQLASYTFDVSILEIISALMFGACICVPGKKDLELGITNIIQQKKITWAFLTPSLVKVINPDDVPTMKTLVLGGEALSRIDIMTWSERLQLANGYGPSECSIAATCNPKISFNSDPFNIGHGMSASLWIVDASDHDVMVPIGSVGELLVEGPILARGYFKDPVKTAAAFIEDPAWAGKTGKCRRFYKTGDLARYNADGTIHFVGRKDTQVKLRGQRIELGEIEHHLKLIVQGAADVAVEMVSRSDRAGDQSLAAFFSVPNMPGLEETGSDLAISLSDNLRNLLIEAEDALSAILPSYMIPSLYIPLKRMPTTTSAKRDRRALMKLASEMTAAQWAMYGLVQETKRAAASDAELLMQRLWGGILKMEPETIGADDSFFRLGGDSIAAMRLVSAAQVEGVSLTMTEIFTNPTLCGLALCVSAAVGDVECTPAPFALVPTIESRRERAGGVAALCGVPKASVADVYPCTPLQEGLLALSVKQQGAYVGQNVLHLPKDVHLERFQKAWERTVETTDILRTRIVYDDAAEASLQVVIREDVTWQHAADLEAYLTEDQKVRVDYGRPLARHAIVDNGTDQHFVLTAHHALYDGWSLPLILERLAQIYENGSAPASTPVSCFVRYLQEVDPSSSNDFWRSRLSNASPSVFPAPPPTIFRERRSEDLVHTIGLSSWSSTVSDVTLSTVIRAAWAMVVSRYSDSDDVLFGVTVTGRNAPVRGIATMLGPTITTVPVRATLGQKSVTEFLRDVQRESTEMIPFEHSGLQNISKLGLEAECNFQNLLVVQPHASTTDFINAGSLGLQSLEVRQTNFHTYPLVMVCSLADEAIEVDAQYDANVLSKEQMLNIVHQFEQAVTQLTHTKSHDQKVAEISLFSERDNSQVMEWNRTKLETVEACVHELVAQKAKASPNAPAITSWDTSMTYEELDQLSSRLAYHLVGQGVGPEILVPFCFEKSAWAIVAMLGVLKAGGACVALNPTHPASRLLSMVQEVSAQVVLVGPGYGHIFEGHVNLIVEVKRSMLDELSTAPVLVSKTVGPENPAFVVFTSGSTGKPKAIVLEHRALCTSAKAHGNAMRMTPTSRVLQFAAYTFDVSLGEIFTTLMFGGCICVPSEQERFQDLAGAINRMEVNWAYLTPTVISLLKPEDVPTLKTLSLGGEAVKQENLSWADNVYLINIYGPAETTIWSTALTGLQKTTSASTIGYALGTGSLMWIVNPTDHNILAPVGCAGELLIEGPILARHYLNEPELTAKSFIENPRWAKGRRFYKTGDIVRYTTNGMLDFVGRKDTQVKLRGQRIELAEIEYHLKLNLGGITDAAVEMVTMNGSPVLAAFFTRSDGNEGVLKGLALTTSKDLQAELIAAEATLESVLPSYMIPSIYIPLTQMPMSVSGKRDRRRLQDLVKLELSTAELAQYTLADAEKRVPSTDMERRLEALWKDVLSLPAVGADDSFFRLGGDSIGAMKLVAAARDHKIMLTVTNVFLYPRLCDMALTVEPLFVKEEDVTTLAPFILLGTEFSDLLLENLAAQCMVASNAVQDAYPCTPLQQGLLALSIKEPGTYVGQNVLKIPDEIDLELFKHAWVATVQTTEILRTRIVYVPEFGSLQVVVNEDIEWEQGHNLEEYLAMDTQIPITYGRKLSRYALIHEGRDRYFVWTAHHAIYDGWSVPLIFEKVAQAFHKGSSTESPSMAGFVKYLMELETAECDDFWRKQLKGSGQSKFPSTLVKDDRQRVEEALEHTFEMTRALSSNVTLSTIIRGAWALVVSKYSESNDIVFGTTMTGRHAPVSGIEHIIGPTFATIPVRMILDHDQRVIDFLEGVQHQSTEMTPYEQIGLRNIAQLGPDEKCAVDFRNLLVVQPTSTSGQDKQAPLGLERIEKGQTIMHSYPLVVECTPHTESILIEARYDNGIFTKDEIDTLVNQFAHVIKQFSQAREETIRDVQMLSSHDHAKIMSWNSVWPAQETSRVHSLVAEQVTKRPDAPAICSWDGSFTYRELDELSTRIASYLISIGVRSEVIVPLCFEKSAWTIISMLGIMKAGGACAAMDPTHPIARLEGIIRDCGADIILTAPQYCEKFEDLVTHVVTIDCNSVSSMPLQYLPLPREVASTDPAFVVFTSGSTGKPKGVVLEHHAVCMTLHDHAASMHIDSSSRVFQFAAYTFDISIGDIFTPLTHGGCVCVPSSHERMNDLTGVMQRLRVTWALLTPTVAALLRPEDLPTLKVLALGGEANRQDLVTTWAEKLILLNAYGPAEGALWSTVSDRLQPGTAAANIGTGKTSLTWVTDPSDYNLLMPVGCVGELLLESPTLARCYLNDTEKTATSFITNPKWASSTGDRPKRRFYRTGDLVRYNPDGSLNHLGRADTQVKLNGQRVELGEIEYHISTIPGIWQGVAVLPKTGRCSKKLVAIVSLLKNDAPNVNGGIQVVTNERFAEFATALRASLSDLLPRHMVPTMFIQVASIPISSSGKLYRQSVLQWIEQLDEIAYQNIYDAAIERTATKTAETEAEVKLQQLCSHVLNVPIDQIQMSQSFVNLEEIPFRRCNLLVMLGLQDSRSPSQTY